MNVSTNKKYFFRNRVPVQPDNLHKSDPKLNNARLCELTTPWFPQPPSLRLPSESAAHSRMKAVTDGMSEDEGKTLRWIGTLSQKGVRELIRRWQQGHNGEGAVSGLKPVAQMDALTAPGLAHPHAGELLMAALLRRAALGIGSAPSAA